MSHLIRVGIQGVRAAFHDVAARRYFGSRGIETLECASFKVLGQKLAGGEADVCLMAIENSIAGSILPNYSLLETHGFKIQGEIYLRIEMEFMALPGQSIDDIRVVQSHPMALLQCEEFLARHPSMKVLEGSDTAESAKEIRERNLLGQGAIASRLAAETYGLEILESGIETNSHNYTRFLVICRSGDHPSARKVDKASVRFEVADRPGCLAEVLQDFSRLEINMTKIQSVPILGRPYEYSFHVDLEWDDSGQYREGMKLLGEKVINLIHFGEYPRSERPSA